MIKDWKSSLLGVLGATVVLALSKGWIDKELATYIGSVLIALFGLNSVDGSSIQSLVGTRPNDR